MDPCAQIEGEKIIRAEGEFGSFVGAASDVVVHGTYRRTGTWSPDLHALLVDDLLRQGGTLLDVGANIGLVSVPVTRARPVRTIAFEPDPRNAELLRRNIALHGLGERVEVHALALWSEEGRLPLARDPKNHGDQRLSRAGSGTSGGAVAAAGEHREGGAIGSRRQVLVTARQLDKVLDLRGFARPVVAKLDTQGAEVDVLLGARASLPEIDYLVCEIWPSGLRRLGRTLAELVELLVGEYDFAKLLLSGESIWPLPPLREEFARLEAVQALYDEDTFFDALVARMPTRPA